MEEFNRIEIQHICSNICSVVRLKAPFQNTIVIIVTVISITINKDVLNILLTSLQ